MAARKKVTAKTSTGKKAPRKKTAGKKVGRRASALARLERELPPTLRDFSRRVRSNLNQLERDVEQARATYRRRAARLLREASHRLGRLEARGERGWRQLNQRARQETLNVLRRLERAVQDTAPPKTTARRKKAPPRETP